MQVRRGGEFDEYDEKTEEIHALLREMGANHKSREIAAGNLKWAKDELICVVAENNQQLPGDGVELVIEAFELITESRTALKWSYAYGYYMPCRVIRKSWPFSCSCKGRPSAFSRRFTVVLRGGLKSTRKPIFICTNLGILRMS
ncbi:hypothetical protein ABFS83_06G157700 [Erythranthe nasuta]